jgi:hypothetical protein
MKSSPKSKPAKSSPLSPRAYSPEQEKRAREGTQSLADNLNRNLKNQGLLKELAHRRAKRQPRS